MKIGKIATVIVISLLIIGLTIYGFSINRNENSNDIILVKHSKRIMSDFKNFDDDYYIEINNIDDYDRYIKNDSYVPDFNNYRYIYFQIGYDNCSETSINPYSFTIKDKTITINVRYTRNCGLCGINDYNYYIVKVDKNEKINNLELNYKSNNDPHCDPNVAYKPIIYLYPKEETDIIVKLRNSNYLTHTYPKYIDNWNVYAYPNGKLIDNNTGRELYGLYWEGNNHKTEVKDFGFVVKGKDTYKFLEEKLSILGLIEREADEFIIYWLPILEESKYNYIRFESIEEIDNYMPLDINPKPDTVIRVLMDYKPLNKKIIVKEQLLDTPIRKGFTVVEWGGSLIK